MPVTWLSTTRSRSAELVDRLLSKEGYQCATTADASEIRHLLDTESFELMLGDVAMPGESVFSLPAHVHVVCPDPTVIVEAAVDTA